MELHSDAEFKWFGLARKNINKTLHFELRRYSLRKNHESKGACVPKNRENEQMV
jgi:hypothetical protein